MKKAPVCPSCHNKKVWKAGLRYLKNGAKVQRWLCTACGFRFTIKSRKKPHKKVNILNQTGFFQPRSNLAKTSIRNGNLVPQKLLNDLPLSFSKDVGSHAVTVMGKSLNELCSYSCKHRVSALQREAKNLAKMEPLKERLAGATTQTVDIKGKIVEFAWQLKKDGLSERTIKSYVERLKTLQKKGAILTEPESVKEIIALQDHWSKGTKYGTVQAYNKFAKLNGMRWNPPRYKPVRKKPFIPLQKELDALIACCGKKTSTLLQLLKETAMRIGEALKLKWTDVDFERNVVTVNHPEKNGESRQIEVSNKLMAMLNRLQKKNDKVFGGITMNTAESNFHVQKKKAAFKLQNPRLKQITFHTFRHWKATMEYHRTKDILHVKQLLGHRDINTTLIYIQLVSFESNEFIPRRAKTKEEEDALIEAGFELVRYDRVNREAIYRKRK